MANYEKKESSSAREKLTDQLCLPCRPSEMKLWRKAFVRECEDVLSRRVREILNAEADRIIREE